MSTSKQREREFVELIQAGCRFYGASELTAANVIALCLQGLADDRALSEVEVKRVILQSEGSST